MGAVYGIFSGAFLIGAGLGILCGLFFNHVFGMDLPPLIMAATGSASVTMTFFLASLR
jgi:hypothetical protein